jgi:two-component system chemotaxis response regulator CheB
MGADGAKELLSMKQRGALTVVQDRESCVVYGMPKVAVDLDAAQHVARPGDIPHVIAEALVARRRQVPAAANRSFGTASPRRLNNAQTKP